MEKFYLTFGVQYPRVPHPYWPGADGKGWVLIEANNYEEARDLARQAFGLSWSHLSTAKHFDEAQMRRRYYPLGKIGYITTAENTVSDPWTVDLSLTPSDPRYYGQETEAHLGNRVEGRLKQDNQPNWGAPYDVEYFHDKCLPDGYDMFATITEVDVHVLNGEMDWANPWVCPACGNGLDQ